MCRFKSGIILKNKTVLTPMSNDSHIDLLETLGIEDTTENALTKFIRVELTPYDDDRATHPKTWKYIVDQDVTPAWYDEDKGRYEQEFRAAVEEWWEKNIVVIAGKAWTTAQKDGCTYYFLNGVLNSKIFGQTNNYATSDVRGYINDCDLVEDLKELFGDRLVPIVTDLTSHYGLKDYGVVEGDILALLTKDLYEECKENIPCVDKWWWLVTPHSTPSGVDSSFVRCVDSDGRMDYAGGCSWRDGGVRPFFILKS